MMEIFSILTMGVVPEVYKFVKLHQNVCCNFQLS